MNLKVKERGGCLDVGGGDGVWFWFREREREMVFGFGVELGASRRSGHRAT